MFFLNSLNCHRAGRHIDTNLFSNEIRANLSFINVLDL